MLQRNNRKQKVALASLDAIQKIVLQGRYEASFSRDLAHYLRWREFLDASKNRWPEVLYQSFTKPNLKFSLNFGQFCHCSKNSRLGYYLFLHYYCKVCGQKFTTTSAGGSRTIFCRDLGLSWLLSFGTMKLNNLFTYCTYDCILVYQQKHVTRSSGSSLTPQLWNERLPRY